MTKLQDAGVKPAQGEAEAFIELGIIAANAVYGTGKKAAPALTQNRVTAVLQWIVGKPEHEEVNILDAFEKTPGKVKTALNEFFSWDIVTSIPEWRDRIAQLQG